MLLKIVLNLPFVLLLHQSYALTVYVLKDLNSVLIVPRFHVLEISLITALLVIVQPLLLNVFLLIMPMEEKQVSLNQFLILMLMILVQFYQEMVPTLIVLVSYKSPTLLMLDVLLLVQTDVVMVVALKVLKVANQFQVVTIYLNHTSV